MASDHNRLIRDCVSFLTVCGHIAFPQNSRFVGGRTGLYVNGRPDILVCARPSFNFWSVECKTARDRLKPAQKEMATQLGERMLVVRPDDYWKILEAVK